MGSFFLASICKLVGVAIIVGLTMVRSCHLRRQQSYPSLIYKNTLGWLALSNSQVWVSVEARSLTTHLGQLQKILKQKTTEILIFCFTILLRHYRLKSLICTIMLICATYLLCCMFIMISLNWPTGSIYCNSLSNKLSRYGATCPCRMSHLSMCFASSCTMFKASLRTE